MCSADSELSIVSFNLLAPIFVRLPPTYGPKTRTAAFPGTLLPGTASQMRPTDKRAGEVQAYAAFPWASDEVL